MRTGTTTTPVASQLTLDLGDSPELGEGVGLPEMSIPDQVSAELEILGLDASRHVMDFYAPMLEALGVTRSRDLLGQRSKAELLVAGRQYVRGADVAALEAAVVGA